MNSLNTHFAVALHMLAAMALFPDELLSSKALSGTVASSPAFLRAVLGRLRDAGIVRSVRGAQGGNTLARAPAEITLLAVFRAVDGEARITAHDASSTGCRLAARMPGFLDALGQRLDAAVAAELAALTVADAAAFVTPFDTPAALPAALPAAPPTALPDASMTQDPHP